jgi:hypothetical protein
MMFNAARLHGFPRRNDWYWHLEGDTKEQRSIGREKEKRSTEKKKTLQYKETRTRRRSKP